VRSLFEQGTGRTVFTAGSMHRSATITAAAGAGLVTSVRIHVRHPHRSLYLPLMLYHGDH
jgi:hypothetical protein